MLAFALVALLAVHIVVCAVREHARDTTEARRLSEMTKAHETDRHSWMRERAELISRIQAPHLIPAPLPLSQPEGAPAPDKPAADEWDLVGQILDHRPDEAPVAEAEAA